MPSCLDPTIKMNCYIDTLNRNLQETYQKESQLTEILAKIESQHETSKIDEKELENLERQVADFAIKINGINTLKDLILVEENKLIDAGANTFILDSMRTRREPAFKEYDALFERVAEYDKHIEKISTETHVNLTLIQEGFVDIKDRQIKLYEKAAEKYKQLKIASSRPQ